MVLIMNNVCGGKKEGTDRAVIYIGDKNKFISGHLLKNIFYFDYN